VTNFCDAWKSTSGQCSDAVMLWQGIVHSVPEVCTVWCGCLGVQVSDDALVVLEGCLDLHTLSCRGCVELTAKGLRHLAALTSLQVLDLERCSDIHGGMAAAGRPH